ncbi:phenylacetate--CoA ligase family protein [Acrocarpospora macrocephala]|uniref:Phenylacetate--CoA ligase n=1 Tax=Acrocarpospora macrocephala TaxID=150177 RepID=A0A5M3WQ81_9ACTN|nr:phenylacetate--CoA ligase family protein [Acrocarpospora macrocephala]GES11104.1 phenylacetate--CoA ligase [Acrocarpospora macrocephala]
MVPIELFRRVAESVPAYAAFLKEQGVDPGAVREFGSVPMTTKDNYVRRHPLAALCRDGVVGDMIAVSSGSSGEPAFWVRSTADEKVVGERFAEVFRAFGAAERRTLAVVCFSLGTWVGGLFTIACVRQLADQGFPVTVVAPGNNKAEILRVLPVLAPQFEQVVLLGYPPFLKDVIDTPGVPWSSYNVKIVTAGEVFSEEWRALVAERAGIADPLTGTASLYGTADAGVLGNETPLSIEIRRFLAGRPDAAKELFGASRLPTLVQYDPAVRFFEEHEGTLLFTGDNGIPLMRYHIADEGGLISHKGMLGYLARFGFRPTAQGPELPFVYVFGRSLFVVSYYGANVFPENVTVGLEQPGVSDSVTGKFVLAAPEGAKGIELTVELAQGTVGTPELAERVSASVLQALKRLNSEFAHYVPEDRQAPVVTLRPYGDPEHFPPGVKHRYVR